MNTNKTTKQNIKTTRHNVYVYLQIERISTKQLTKTTQTMNNIKKTQHDQQKQHNHESITLQTNQKPYKTKNNM